MSENELIERLNEIEGKSPEPSADPEMVLVDGGIVFRKGPGLVWISYVNSFFLSLLFTVSFTGQVFRMFAPNLSFRMQIGIMASMFLIYLYSDIEQRRALSKPFLKLLTETGELVTPESKVLATPLPISEIDLVISSRVGTIIRRHALYIRMVDGSIRTIGTHGCNTARTAVLLGRVCAKKAILVRPSAMEDLLSVGSETGEKGVAMNLSANARFDMDKLMSKAKVLYEPPLVDAT